MALSKIKKNSFMNKINKLILFLIVSNLPSQALMKNQAKAVDQRFETKWYPKNRKLSETYSKDYLDGAISLFYNNGQREWRRTYYKGLLHGISTTWNQKGNRLIEGHFESGDSVGLWIWWDSNGKIKNKKLFKKSKRYSSKNDVQYRMKL